MRDHVQLGYARTVHSAQGTTVDSCILAVDGPIDHPALCTPMTRGRLANHAHVVTAIGDTRTARDVLTDALSHTWADQPAHRHLPHHPDHIPPRLDRPSLRR